MSNGNAPRAHWGSRLGFILAAAGSAIGLGNIWKFPYITGKNGGGAFVLVYLACIALVALPIMMSEFFIGRRGQRDAVGSFAALEGPRSPWCLVGWMGVIASFILLSFYAVVAGWSFDYVVKAAGGAFAGRSPEEIDALFGALVSSPLRVVAWQALFVFATGAIVAGGIRSGIERWSKILMPVLFGLLVLLFVQGMLSPGAGAALTFMFRPDFTSLTGHSILEALGHAFFTLSLGAGAMITYGSYLERDADVFALSLRIALLDTVVAMLAGLAIFPVVFAAGLEPGAGPGLVFQTIPIVFSAMPFGSLLAVVFFVLLAFAALSSSISMLEVSVAYCVDEKGWARRSATALLGAFVFLLGIPSALSFNLWIDVKPLFGLGFFDFFDALISSCLFPLGGLFIAIYTGWVWKAKEEQEEFLGGTEQRWVFPLWHFLVCYVAPAAVLTIILNQVGVL